MSPDRDIRSVTTQNGCAIVVALLIASTLSVAACQGGSPPAGPMPVPPAAVQVPQPVAPGSLPGEPMPLPPAPVQVSQPGAPGSLPGGPPVPMPMPPAPVQVPRPGAPGSLPGGPPVPMPMPPAPLQGPQPGAPGSLPGGPPVPKPDALRPLPGGAAPTMLRLWPESSAVGPHAIVRPPEPDRPQSTSE
jgi:hypothetical protein